MAGKHDVQLADMAGYRGETHRSILALIALLLLAFLQLSCVRDQTTPVSTAASPSPLGSTIASASAASSQDAPSVAPTSFPLSVTRTIASSTGYCYYEVTASRVTYGVAEKASVTYRNSGGDIQQANDVDLPWSQQVETREGQSLYISAQNAADSGDITVKIVSDGETLKESTSYGAYCVAEAGCTAPIPKPVVTLEASKTLSSVQVYSVALSVDGNVLVTGTEDGITLWDLKSEKILQTVQVEKDAKADPSTGRNDARVTSVALSPDGRMIASGGKHAMLWSVSANGGIKELRTLGGIPESFIQVAFSPDGNLLAGGGWGAPELQGLCLWDIRSGKARYAFDHANLSLDPASLAFSSDGGLLAVGGNPGIDGKEAVKLIGTASGKVLHAFANPEVYAVTMSPDGKSLATADLSGIKIWDRVSGAMLRSMQLSDVGGDACRAYSPDGKLLASGSGQVRLWNPETGKLLRLCTGNQYTPGSLLFSHDGHMLIAGCATIMKEYPPPGGQIAIWVLPVSY